MRQGRTPPTAAEPHGPSRRRCQPPSRRHGGRARLSAAGHSPRGQARLERRTHQGTQADGSPPMAEKHIPLPEAGPPPPPRNSREGPDHERADLPPHPPAWPPPPRSLPTECPPRGLAAGGWRTPPPMIRPGASTRCKQGEEVEVEVELARKMKRPRHCHPSLGAAFRP